MLAVQHCLLWEPAHCSNFFPIHVRVRPSVLHVHLPRQIEDLERGTGNATAATLSIRTRTSSFFLTKRHVRINEGGLSTARRGRVTVYVTGRVETRSKPLRLSRAFILN